MFDEFETHEEKDYLEVQLTENTEEKEDRETKELPHLKVANAPSGNLFFWSALISLCSVANPLFSSLANNLQTQNLYAGWAMTQGKLAYGDIYGTGGVLYYLLNWLGSSVLGSLLFAFVQFLALFVAGNYLFQFVYQLTRKKELAQQLLSLFYLFVLTVGFGGLYASIFVLPFTMWGLNFLARYMNGQISDNGFILFGAIAALAFLIDPFTSIIFYGLVFLVWTIFHFVRKRAARGFYQLLASLLGFSLLFYPIGYYTVWNGTFGLAISQATYLFESMGIHSGVLENLMLYGGLFLGLGFVTALIMGVSSSAEKDEWPFRLLGSLGLLVILMLSIFSPIQGAFQLLPAIPFAMILFATWFSRRFTEGRHIRSKRTPSVWKNYVAGNFFLPVLAIAFLVVMPFAQRYALSGAETAEREVISGYIRDESKTDDKIYAWDNTASLYLSTSRLSASSILSPKLYVDTAENKLRLEKQLDASLPRYIAVNEKVPLLPNVKKLLSSSYKKIDVKTSRFKLYELK